MKFKLVVIDIEIPRAVKRAALLLLLTSSVAAAVPYTFTTGDILSSKAVNANFADLDSRLGTGRMVATNDAGVSYSTGFTVYCGETAAVTGAFASGTKVGFAAAKAQCETVPGCSRSAHMCTSEEVVRSSQMGYPTGNGWFSTGSTNAATTTAPVNDCNGWRTGDNTVQGSLWTGTGSEFVGWIGCSTAEPILCCD